MTTNRRSITEDTTGMSVQWTYTGGRPLDSRTLSALRPKFHAPASDISSEAAHSSVRWCLALHTWLVAHSSIICIRARVTERFYGKPTMTIRLSASVLKKLHEKVTACVRALRPAVLLGRTMCTDKKAKTNKNFNISTSFKLIDHYRFCRQLDYRTITEWLTVLNAESAGSLSGVFSCTIDAAVAYQMAQL